MHKERPRKAQDGLILKEIGKIFAVERVALSGDMQADFKWPDRQDWSSEKRLVVVFAETKSAHANYKAAFMEAVPSDARERVSFLTPEELPDFVESFGIPAEPTEQLVRGYRVKTTVLATSPETARARKEAVGRLIARSLAQKKD